MAGLLMATVAPGSSPPLPSATRPVMVPVVPWAQACAATAASIRPTKKLTLARIFTRYLLPVGRHYAPRTAGVYAI